MQVWVKINETDGRYEVNSTGQVRNAFQLNQLKSRKSNSNGYIRYTLYNNNKPITLTQHRLISIYFIPNPGNKKYVNHKNGIRHDNRIENLEWCTMAENNRHAVNRIRKKEIKKLSMSDLDKMYFDFKNSTLREAASKNNIDMGAMQKLLFYMHPLY